MIYLLDTNICIRYLNGRAPLIRSKMDTIADTDIAISTITQGEMFAGSARSQTPLESRARQGAFFIRFAKLPFDEASADEFGRIRGHLLNAGAPSARMTCRLQRWLSSIN